MSSPNITLYTRQTSNGIKISIVLEELGLPYETRQIDMAANEQKSDWFSEINPNQRIPAITDTLDDGSQVRVFESGSIMQYLVARYDKDFKISYSPGTKEHIEMTNWLFFQMAGVGPMQGQANHFVRYAATNNEYAAKRYQDEVKRLYGVLDKHLSDAGTPFLVGQKCTIADIAHWGWVSLSRWSKIELDEFPALKAWEERVFARPGVERGRHVPEKHQRELLQDAEATAAFEERARGFYRQKEKEKADAEAKAEGKEK